MQRIRIRFGKDGPARFTSHLDLAQAWARWLRRARIPIAHSHGFNPQPRLNLAAALPLGFTSQAELIDLWLEEPMLPAQIARQLAQTAPPGLNVYDVVEADLTEKSTQARLTAVEYRVTGPFPADLQGRIESLLSAGSLPRERRGKTYDLRPLIERLWLEPDDEAIGMRLVAQPGAMGRPDELLLALGLDPFDDLIHRTRLVFDSGD
jgi:radical SAM-linked protein